MAKHLNRRHEGKRLPSDQEAQLGLQFCSCQTYWGRGESINRHYRPHAPAGSQKHRDRCRLLGVNPDAPLCDAPASPGTPDLCDPTPPPPTTGINVDDSTFSELEPPPLPSAPLSAPPDPAYVLTARVWRDLPRQFWPAWRAAVRLCFPSTLLPLTPNALLLGLPAALLPPRVGGRRRCLRDLNARLADPVASLAVLLVMLV